jgi:hypothetical protein
MYAFLTFPIYIMPRRSHLPLFDHSLNIWWEVQNMDFLYSPVTFSFLDQNSSSAPCSRVTSVLIMKDRVSSRTKQTKLKLLILISTFLDSIVQVNVHLSEVNILYKCYVFPSIWLSSLFLLDWLAILKLWLISVFWSGDFNVILSFDFLHLFLCRVLKRGCCVIYHMYE